MNRSTTAERLMALGFVTTLVFTNILALMYPTNEAILQAALQMNASVVGGFIGLSLPHRQE
jgi:hypothetical protein